MPFDSFITMTFHPDLSGTVLSSSSPVVSQVALAVMFVVLGTLLLGVGFGVVSKSKESLLQHRWILTIAVVMALAAVILVMAPSTFVFYIDPNLQFFSVFSTTILVHAIVGFPATVSALIYVFGDLPQNVKKWMRISAGLWLTAILLGAFVFLQKLTLI